jgi:hemerythrin
MCADRARDGASVVQDLPSAIRLLVDAVRRHNQREEHLLRDLIPTVDAWGQMRAEIMTDEHVHEHNLLHRTLLGTPSELAGPDISQLLDRLIQHMAREEEAFLNERVLRDDVVAIDLCDG